MSQTSKLLILLAFCGAFYWTFPFVQGATSASTSPVAVEESNSPASAKDPSWWLESGGFLNAEEDGWKTIEGSLNSEDKWRKHYLRTNPLDTDNGYHPQNIFRLFSLQAYSTPVQELRFVAEHTNLSDSPNRNAKSGVFLYSRYIDESNYYYAGIQMDGKIAIIKKYAGIFETLAEVEIFTGQYERDTNPTLIPHSENLGLRVVTEESEGLLNIEVSLARGDGEWEEVLRVGDSGKRHGPILTPGRVGLRSDFMDNTFTSYLVRD